MKHLYLILLAVGCPFLSDAQSLNVDSLRAEPDSSRRIKQQLSRSSDKADLSLSSEATEWPPINTLEFLSSVDEELDAISSLILELGTDSTAAVDGTDRNSAAISAKAQRGLPRNEIRLDNYYQSDDQFDQLPAVKNQSVASLMHKHNLFGVGMVFGATLYADDGKADIGRSGITLTFDRNQYLEDLQRKSQIDPFDNLLDGLTIGDPSLLLARQEIFLRKYLRFTKEEIFREVHVEARRVADSLEGYYVPALDEKDRRYIELDRRIRRLRIGYQQVFANIETAAPSLLTEGKSQLDSITGLLSSSASEDYLLAQLHNHIADNPAYTTLQKLAIFARRFSVGNTNLPDVGHNGVALPIRGIDFAYERNGFGVEAQIGVRVMSNRFTPRDGFVYHDTQRGMRFARIGLNYSDRADRIHLAFSLTDGAERNANRRNAAEVPMAQATSPEPLRRNQVLRLHNVNQLTEALHIDAEFSYAQVSPRGSPISFKSDNSGLNTTADTEFRAGVGFQPGENISFSMSGFYTGVNFQNFANPYQYTDFQGVEVEVQCKGLAQIFDASFSLAGGAGTTEISKSDYRWRAQGQISAQVSSSSSMILIVSPNVYRYSVTGREGLSESSIYQFLYNYVGRKSGTNVQLGITNFEQGLTWADSSSATKSLVLTGNALVPLSPKVSINLRGQQTLGKEKTPQFGDPNNQGVDNRSTGTFFYGAGARMGFGNHQMEIGADYGRFGLLDEVGLGANLSYACSLGRWANLRLTAFVRPGIKSTTGGDPQPNTPNQLFSQQSWSASF